MKKGVFFHFTHRCPKNVTSYTRVQIFSTHVVVGVPVGGSSVCVRDRAWRGCRRVWRAEETGH